MLVDLPVEVNAIPERSELSSVQHRLSGHAIDWLTSEELTGMEDVDLFWMSQFLDCFSLDEAASILERTRRAMKPGANSVCLNRSLMSSVIRRQRSHWLLRAFTSLCWPTG